MRESIHKYFQVGTIRWMSFPNRSVVDQVKRIAVDDYFDAIEVTKCADDAEREEVKKILEQSHFKGLLWRTAETSRAEAESERHR